MKTLIPILLFAALCVSGCYPSYYDGELVRASYPDAEIHVVRGSSSSFYVRKRNGAVFIVSVQDKGSLSQPEYIFPAK